MARVKPRPKETLQKINPQLDISRLALIAANIIPMVGALFFGWDILNIMLIYWAESAVIGLYTIFKIIIVAVQGLKHSKFGALAQGLFMIPFFSFHFGMFMFAHLMFIMVLFGGNSFGSGPQKEFVDILGENLVVLLYGVSAFLVSHGVSFFVHFVGQKQWQKVLDNDFLSSALKVAGTKDKDEQKELAKELMEKKKTSQKTGLQGIMMAPYPRIIVMHITIIASGFFVAISGLPEVAVIILVVLKTLVDNWSHTREHLPDYESQ